ncbi:MAG: dihydrodipicolinate synthase family protein [Planctomycetes bacterium]|nr:dihydrodipicolinate synthase family protein [Planctomycetota bacterium]
MTRSLRGVLCALATPFSADGSRVDEPALRDLVDGLIGQGIHGLVPCGSTGEFAALRREERKQVVEVVIDQTGGRVPVVPHTGATSTAIAIELAQHAESLGADGVMVVQPYYEPMTLDEVYGYFKDISDAIRIPMMVYNIPSCTGQNLPPAFLARLGREIENVRYVKDSTGDLSQLSELLLKYADDVVTFNGWDTVSFSGLALGSTGTIWGAANVAPRQCVDLFNLIEAGRLDEARVLWNTQLWPIMQFLVTEGYLASVKAGANLIGFRVGEPRPPFRPLSPDKITELRRLLVAAGTLREAVAL